MKESKPKPKIPYARGLPGNLSHRARWYLGKGDATGTKVYKIGAYQKVGWITRVIDCYGDGVPKLVSVRWAGRSGKNSEEEVETLSIGLLDRLAETVSKDADTIREIKLIVSKCQEEDGELREPGLS